jgi:MFS family permease
VRVTLAVLVVVPPGFFMGMPFPVGIALLGERRRPLIPWAWAANGVASVLGPALAIFLATVWGNNLIILAGAVMYVAAFAALSVARRASRA